MFDPATPRPREPRDAIVSRNPSEVSTTSSRCEGYVIDDNSPARTTVHQHILPYYLQRSPLGRQFATANQSKRPLTYSRDLMSSPMSITETSRLALSTIVGRATQPQVESNITPRGCCINAVDAQPIPAEKISASSYQFITAPLAPSGVWPS